MTEPTQSTEMWEQLEALVEAEDAIGAGALLDSMTSGETARAISRLDEDHQAELFGLIDVQAAARVADELSHGQAADIFEDMEPEEAARIIDLMPSDEQADVLTELDEDDAEAIIDKMAPEEAADVRQLVTYPQDSAGGVMITEYLAFQDDLTVNQVLAGLRQNVEGFTKYDVQYLYVVSEVGHLTGVVRIKDLVLSELNAPITSILVEDAMSVSVDADLDELEEFFDRYNFLAAPVVDAANKLLGVVRQAFVEEALGDRAEGELLRFGGVVGGEELRTMPVISRSLRRLAFLCPTTLMAVVSVSVIAMNEGIVEQVPALAIFLPLVAGISGSVGNQAIAVSMRELSLGLVLPRDVGRVAMKELQVAMIVGLSLGILTFFVALLFQGNPYLGMVVGGTVPLTVIGGGMVGGSLPLILRGMKLDPAMLSGPLLTNFTDFTVFLIVLTFAHFMMAHLIT